MKSSQTITVIVPVYNAGKYLIKCVQSIINQTYKEFNLILVDDGSSDDSPSICDNFSHQDSRIITIHKQNSGASQARNVGIDTAISDLICFVDADDIIEQDYLKDLYDDYCKAKDADFVIQGMSQIWPDHIDEFRLHDNTYDLPTNQCVFFKDIRLIDYSGPYCKLFRKSILDKYAIRFSPAIIYGEDLDFVLRYLGRCNVVVSSSCTNYSYIMHEGSVSSKFYSFTKENSGISQLFDSFSALQERFHSPELLDMMTLSIRAYLWRLIYTNYHSSYERNERISNLRNIHFKIVKFLSVNYRSSSTFTKVVKYLLVYRQYHILDLMLGIIYKWTK